MMNIVNIDTYSKPKRLISENRNRPSASMLDPLNYADKVTWVSAVREKLSRLAELSNGWDSYDSERIPMGTIVYTATTLSDLWTRGLPVPDITPMSSDGLMVEWFGRECELTIEVNGPYDIHYIIEHPQRDILREGHVTKDQSDLEDLTSRFVESINPAAIAI